MGMREEFYDTYKLSQLPSAEATWLADWQPYDTGANDLVFQQMGRLCSINGLLRYTGATGSKSNLLNAVDLSGSRIPLPTGATAYGAASLDYGGSHLAFRVNLTTAGLLQVGRAGTWTATLNAHWPISIIWIDGQDWP